jgi:hypothetical protein
MAHFEFNISLDGTRWSLAASMDGALMPGGVQVSGGSSGEVLHAIKQCLIGWEREDTARVCYQSGCSPLLLSKHSVVESAGAMLGMSTPWLGR